MRQISERFDGLGGGWVSGKAKVGVVFQLDALQASS
jgi:hypothetical protein